MDRVKDLLRTKGAEVWSVAPDATVLEALKVMADRNIGAVLVTEAGCPVGILSERDYARKIALFGRSSRETLVRDIMTKRVIYVHPEQTAEECMALMTEKRIRHLPVMEGERVAGIISIGDVVKSIISRQQFLIEQLERYITGRP